MLSPRSQQTLFTLPAFRGLGEAERKHVAGFFREIALEKDAVIYRAGDDADALYLLASGAVDVLDGEEMIARYGPGEVFGEAAVFAGEQRAVTTRVALDAVLLVLRRDSIDRLLELHPMLHQRVSALMARRLKEALQVATGGRRARARKIVVLQGWRSAAERSEFALALAGALERELGRSVAIVTVASPTGSNVAARRDRPDAVVVAEGREPGALRARVASELALRAAQAPVVLVVLDDALATVALHVFGRLRYAPGRWPTAESLTATTKLRRKRGHWGGAHRRSRAAGGWNSRCMQVPAPHDSEDFSMALNFVCWHWQARNHGAQA